MTLSSSPHNQSLATTAEPVSYDPMRIIAWVAWGACLAWWIVALVFYILEMTPPDTPEAVIHEAGYALRFLWAGVALAMASAWLAYIHRRKP